MPADKVWWRDGVLYQIYPRSFSDSNGDGIGDLRGIIERLDHLGWLGIDGLWINPVMPSPNMDWGYDVSDYKAVDPELGTLEDVDELVAEAGQRDIRILFDLVPNHTSDQHPWFRDAIGSRTARYRDLYVWADPKEGGPPNNWLSVFGGESAWELDEASGQYYLHNFLRHQPDLNWWNDQVREEFDDILRFWFDRGVAGFRIDVAHAMIKDRELRDNLPVDDETDERARRIGQQPIYNMNRPEAHEVIQRWRALSDRFDPPRILVGETFVLDLGKMIAFYGERNDELNLAFNFPFVFASLDGGALRKVVDETESLLLPESWPVWTGSNHDVGRLGTRWCEGAEDRTRCALMMLLTLRGTPFLYYGDEIGMVEPELTKDQLRDPVGLRFWPEPRGRDGCRTPMQWTPEKGAGFTTPEATPWLPIGDAGACNVADQRHEARSVLHLTRALIMLRASSPDLQTGSYEPLETPQGVWAWRRGERVTVALNLSSQEVTLEDLSGEVALSTNRDRDGDRIGDRVSVGPWEGLVIQT
ncbi:MAG: DUF3459 domain-containing protein [Actinobacteria bacterium]|nr:DUF3459 domain-containing protein [Actinomycetota bacterium]